MGESKAKRARCGKRDDIWSAAAMPPLFRIESGGRAAAPQTLCYTWNNPPMLESGARLSHFEIVSPLGSGGMGEVFAALDLDLGRRVAIKVLPPEATRDESRIARFVAEAKAASALNHPNIVTVYEVGRIDGVHFIAMELVEGETLRDRLGRTTDANTLLPLFSQIADGLAKAHAAGIIHRDLKPENVMVTPDGFAKILDFGLAKLVQLEPSTPDEKTMARNLTEAGTVVGTIGYMSPEQLRGERVDPRTDIFALGCMLYEAFAGQQPFRGASRVDSIHNVLHATPPPLRDHDLQRIVTKALAKNPSERYQSVRDLALDLKQIQSTVRTGTAVPRRRKPLLAIAAAAVAIAIALVVVMPRLGKNPSETAAARGFEQMAIVPLPATGGATFAAISPDGRYVAFTRQQSEGVALVMRQISSGSEVTLVPPHAGTIGRPIFSRDGDSIFFNEGDALFQIPVIGGTPRKVIDRVSGNVTFSPDGKRFCFMRQGSLFTASSDGSNITRVAGATSKESFHDPSWSADPNLIVTVRRSLQGPVRENLQLIRLDVADPVAAASTAHDMPGEWTSVTLPAWLPDASGVIISATTSFVAPRQLLFVPKGDGAVRRLTNDLYTYSNASMSTDGSTIAAVQTDARWEIAEYRLGDSRPVRQIAEGSGAFTHVATSADGTVAYTQPSEEGLDLWITASPGTKQLTSSEGDEFLPSFSPDGQTIVYVAEEGDRRRVWRVDRDGSNRTAVTNGRFENNPRWSPDGQWIYYTSRDTGRALLMKTAATGGKPTVIPTDFVTRPAVSPDGKVIAAVTNLGWKLGIIDALTGKKLKETSIADLDGQLRWTVDGRKLAFVRTKNDVSNVWLLDIRTGAIEQITRLDRAGLGSFDWGPDGKSVVCSLTTESRRVVLIRGFH